jgi:ABC-type nitrate/sulfonate/bicarbonate transport system substrate-binding protein
LGALFRRTNWLIVSLILIYFAWPVSVLAKSVTLAYQTPTLSGILPSFVGTELGFFASEGLELRQVFVKGGPTATAALISGDVDFALISGVASVRAIVQGAPLVIVGGSQPYMDYTLIGAKGIATLNDLKGKTVGVTGAGGVAEYAAVEGLARKGLVRDRDYKILYGVGNSPARAQGLEAGRMQASPFSFMERVDLEQKGFPILMDIGKVISGFPFVVIVSSRKKAETDPEGTTAFLRAMKRGMDLVKTDKEKVIATVVKKGTYGDPATIRKVVEQFSGVYSISITKEDIDALIVAGKIEAEAKKFGGTEKFFTGAPAAKALGQSR